jgi:hypothetical protein
LFTAQDYQDQLLDPDALREALKVTNINLRDQRRKYQELDIKLADAHRTIRDEQAISRGLMDENTALEEQIEGLKDENLVLRQRLASVMSSESDFVMSGGSGESSDGVKRSGSKRHSKSGSHELKDRMKQRINKGNPEAEASSSKSSHKDLEKKRERRSSMSQDTRKEPYIEKLPRADRRDRGRGPPLTTRGFEGSNYITDPPLRSSSTVGMDAAAMSPRSGVSSSHNAYPIAGDYYPSVLPPKTDTKNSSGRKHRDR